MTLRVNPEHSIPLDVLQHALRAGLPFVGIASIVLAAAIVAIVLSKLRAHAGLLFWLGIFALIYAIRLFFENGLILAASQADPKAFQLVVALLTYVIPIPYALFSREYFGPGWKNSFVIWLWCEIVFAPLAIAAVLFGFHPVFAFYVNNTLIIAGTLLVMLHLLLRRTAVSAVLKSGIAVTCALVILNNFRFRPAGINLEPVGFLMLLSVLGFTASQEAISKERKLTEVEHELATARRIQSSILPLAPPELPGLRIASRYQPMTAVAGDFYDFLQIREDLLTILVADVSGHGVPAALVASTLKICFASQTGHASDPAKILAGLNTMLRPVLADEYVTAACAAVDLSAKTVTYSGAGHPPALLLHNHSGQVVQLAENGLFIGPFPQATYSNISVPFISGDKLLLYTDGITEATISGGEEFGIARLTNFLLSAGNIPPAEFIDQLFGKIATNTQEDDRTAVLAQFD